MNKLYFLLLPFLLFACKDENPDLNGSNPPDPLYEVPTVIPKGDEQYLFVDSDFIYDQNKLHTFELVIPDAALARIDANPAAEEYVEAMLVFQGDTISPVGVRYIGSIGAFVGCLTGSDWANPSGSKTCTKLSMKVKINWEGREDRFYDLKKLQFHSMNNDDSQMRDRLAYWLFREMDIPAPRCIHARLVINGNYVGLFALPEQIDGRFTRYNFENGKGNLNKEVWPLHANGQPQSDQTFLANLKTNEDESPSVHLIRSFGEEIAAANDNNIQTIISNWMNIDEIISYAVVDRTIRVDDGPFHWYCTGGDCSNHNYYWYEDPTSEMLHLIPWDMDNAFENIIFNANPVTPIADGWGETSNNCEPFSTSFLGIKQRSAACDKLTAGWAMFEDEFEQLKTEFIEGPLSEARVNERLEVWGNQIREVTLEASQEHGDAVAIANWESAMSQLKEQLKFAREN